MPGPDVIEYFYFIFISLKQCLVPMSSIIFILFLSPSSNAWSRCHRVFLFYFYLPQAMPGPDVIDYFYFIFISLKQCLVPMSSSIFILFLSPSSNAWSRCHRLFLFYFYLPQAMP